MDLKEKIKLLPDLPGSYQYFDENGTVIYVGKAKSLKKRVSSYFTGSHDAKTSSLVMNIKNIEYIVTSSELDALLLELNLIKQYNPRYNIMLTDDKTYPYIAITNEQHPRLVVTRNLSKKYKYHFGPYPNVKAARETVKLLHKIYPLRKCDHLPKTECLYYHMGQCLAPCINNVTEDDYQEIILSIKRFLKGDIKEIISNLENKMQEASLNLEFEKALEYKNTIEAVNLTTNKQKINLNDLKDRDIIGYAYNESFIAIELFFVRNGKISARHQEVFQYHDDHISALEEYIARFYEQNEVAKEVYLPNELNTEILQEYLSSTLFTPQKGDKYKLMNLAQLNALQTLNDKTKIVQKEMDRTIHSIEELGKLLMMQTPYRIEAFDNSNLFGEAMVSAMVSFVNGKPAKKEYRKFKMKEAKNQSDFHMMKEVLYRRYFKVLMEDLTRPDLIIIDGGKAQLTATKEILDSLNLNIPFIGLVKDNTHSTNHILLPNLEEIHIDTHSDVFHLLTRIQDEAHRFAVTFHRQVRSKGLFASQLDEIKGVGKITKETLLKHFKSVNLIKEASFEELVELGISKKLAEHILNQLKN